MERFTTDNPNTNLQSILNLFYVKDHEAYVRGGGPAPDYKDISLNDFARRIAERYHLDLPESDEELPDAMFECLVDGIDTMDGILALIYNAGWAFAEIRHRLSLYEDIELTPEEIEQQFKNFSSFLMEMTGGRMSKTNYTVQAMVAEANDCRQKELDEAQQEGYDLGVESVLRNHFDIPWAEAADLRKNINHLRELLKAEQEGRLVVLPCSIDSSVYLIHQEEGQKRKPKSYRVDECDIDHFTIGETMIPMITAVSKDNEWHELIDGTQEGYEYFLTQEAAEAALAKDTNVPGKKEV